MLLNLELAGQGIGDAGMHGVRLASALKAMYMPNCLRPRTQITYSGFGGTFSVCLPTAHSPVY